MKLKEYQKKNLQDVSDIIETGKKEGLTKKEIQARIEKHLKANRKWMNQKK